MFEYLSYVLCFGLLITFIIYIYIEFFNIFLEAAK